MRARNVGRLVGFSVNVPMTFGTTLFGGVLPMIRKYTRPTLNMFSLPTQIFTQIYESNSSIRPCNSVEVKLFRPMFQSLLFQLLLFASVVGLQFYEGADEQTANNL